MTSRRKPDPVQEQMAALRKRLAATDARVSALTMRGGLERRDESEVIELRAAVDGLRRVLFGSKRAPLRPLFAASALMRTIPGLAAQFRGEVPASHLVLPSRGPETADVRCRCAQIAVVREDQFALCDCGRVFAMLDGVVVVARPPLEPSG